MPQFYIFTQNIVKESAKRKLKCITCFDRKMIFTFDTHRAWAGNNLDEFFGRIDDDLFGKMLVTITL